MTKLTDELTAHLEKSLHRKFVKDEGLNKWFDGAAIKADIQQLKKAFLAAGLGRGDVVFMCLANSAVYLPINQALWQLGITAHSVSATTSAFELVTDYQQNGYPAMIFAPQTAEAFNDFTELERHDLKLNTFEDLAFFNKKGLSNANKAKTPLESSFGWILNTLGTTGKPKKLA
ncbi:AMP-binding protein [Liquorilactobacillus vini]|uniref:AMP-binding protein n=1 Tax=Liquorilactobacillus vini TaxID=238015 RepID=UPI00031AF801|nr:AMP-binding protein [Liquorilactobacillus vini]